MKWAKSIQTAF